MVHGRLALAFSGAFLVGHTCYVLGERKKSPTGRMLQFSPGSQDDIVSEGLRTGDTILFSRDCVLYGACGAFSCAVRRSMGSGGSYDHVGVIYVHHGEPHVLEYTNSGVKFRKYSARVRCSRSREIVVRPLLPGLGTEGLELASRFVVREVGPIGVAGGRLESPPLAMSASLFSITSSVSALKEAFVALLINSSYNSSVSFVERFYSDIGVIKVDGTNDVALDMSDVAPGKRSKQGALKLGAPIWVRDLS